eukprot:11172308-Lingulodinium_polyedra.AAC.1
MARMRPSSPVKSAQATSTAGHHCSECSEPALPAPQRGQTSCVLGPQVPSWQPQARAASMVFRSAEAS